MGAAHGVLEFAKPVPPLDRACRSDTSMHMLLVFSPYEKADFTSTSMMYNHGSPPPPTKQKLDHDQATLAKRLLLPELMRNNPSSDLWVLLGTHVVAYPFGLHLLTMLIPFCDGCIHLLTHCHCFPTRAFLLSPQAKAQYAPSHWRQTSSATFHPGQSPRPCRLVDILAVIPMYVTMANGPSLYSSPCSSLLRLGSDLPATFSVLLPRAVQVVHILALHRRILPPLPSPHVLPPKGCEPDAPTKAEVRAPRSKPSLVASGAPA